MKSLVVVLCVLVGAVAGGSGCQSDTMCSLLSTSDYRCLHDATASGPQANCHLPGGTTKNSTCSCQTPTCQPTPAAPTNSSATQYLMIGDSISLGMEKYVSGNLSAKGLELTHNPGNAASANFGYHCLDAWLADSTRKWHIVSYNFGLHDLAYDTERVSVEQYTQLLTLITERLVSLQQRDGTKLLYVYTTPVPNVPVYEYGGPCNNTKTCIDPPRYYTDAKLFNDAAQKVIEDATAKGAKIATVDLFSFVNAQCGGYGYKHCDGFQLPYNVHYTDNGWQHLAEVMTAAVLKAAV